MDRGDNPLSFLLFVTPITTSTILSRFHVLQRVISLFEAGRVEEALDSCCQVLKEQSPADVKESLLQVLTHMPLAQAKRRPTPLTVSMLVEICVTADLQ